MGTRRFYSIAVGQLPIILVIFIIHFNISAGECQPGEQCCQSILQDCWDLYETAQEALGVRDSIRPNRLTPEERQAICKTLRTFHTCIRNMTRYRGCQGNLNFHGSSKVVEKQMKQKNCSSDGPIFKLSEYNPGQNKDRSLCSYRGGGPYKYCDLFGDPHLRTFDDQFQTCKVRGAWPLISNDVLTVQVTNEAVGIAEASATAISKLTVVVNRDDVAECAGNHYLTYQAQSDLPLPATFTDGRRHAGKQQSVLITEVSAGSHVELYLRYVDTTIVVRLVGNHFTFGIKMPEKLVNGSHERDSDFVQLCTKGCPSAERIDYRELLSHSRAQDTTSAMPLTQAEDLCRSVGVVDYYFDSCVFDLISTGDVNFTLAAQYALQDAMRLFPQTAKWQQNRTSVVMEQSVNSAAQRTPHWAGCSSPGSLCLLLLTCLIISHTRT